MLNALMWIGEILVGVSTGWLLTSLLLGVLFKTEQSKGDPNYHATVVGNQ